MKFISKNDVGATGGHQSGFYLPKNIWRLYSPNGPVKGKNFDHPVHIIWQNGKVTDSIVKWYGNLSRSEFRLTHFGRGFDFLSEEGVGNLLIIIPKTIGDFSAFVLDSEDDIDAVTTSLGIQPFKSWAVYEPDAPLVIDENECLRREFESFASTLMDFPSGDVMSEAVRAMIGRCCVGIPASDPDGGLLKCYETEYKLFQTIERKLCGHMLASTFKSVDNFVEKANSILNRRKSRAGRSLENHVDYFLKAAGIPHDIRPQNIPGKPDVVIPSATAYLDNGYGLDKLFVVGVKTTCKDRWRQIISEAPRVKKKHILTIQQGISSNQLDEMSGVGVSLIVPKGLQHTYPEHKIEILSLGSFVTVVKKRLGATV